MIKQQEESKACVVVAVFAPLRTAFDYLPPDFLTNKGLHVGQRVWVPFGKGCRGGVILSTDGIANSGVALKKIIEPLDPVSLLTPEVIELAKWASKHYHYPIGETFSHTFPAGLRKRKKLQVVENFEWLLTKLGRDLLRTRKIRGVRQINLLSRMSHVNSMNSEDFKDANLGYPWRPVLNALIEKKLVGQKKISSPDFSYRPINSDKVTLNKEQIRASEQILKQSGGYSTTVLYGVTGSGKTEVYMEIIEYFLRGKKQSLILVPEITLTEQIVQRFRKRFGGLVGVLHSQCKDSEKIAVWDSSRNGRLKVLIGTRSSIWVPMKSLGVIVVDEEHDSSYKQQDGLPYSGRDLAIKRAQIEKVPVILGSATPSLETLANVSEGRYDEIKITQKAKALSEPIRELVDMGKEGRESGLGRKLVQEIKVHVSEGGQALLFLNRRGYAPVVMCRSCGTHQLCKNCERHLIYHKGKKALVCHHCGRQQRISEAFRCCENQNLFDVGVGTEQVEERVRELFPKMRIHRIDRDSVRTGKDLRELFRKISSREIDILIGTQMVAKGLDFSGITLVGIIDTDNRLFSIDYKSEERLAQLLTQVAGRCGRGMKEGKVLIQSNQPENPVLKKIIFGGYRSYSSLALKERRRMGMPPFSALAIIRADSSNESRSDGFLNSLRKALTEKIKTDEIFVSYPIPALLSPKYVKYRSLMVVQCKGRGMLQSFLSEHLLKMEALGREMRVRWGLQVDPEDTL